jgi:hypothetical protein
MKKFPFLPFLRTASVYYIRFSHPNSDIEKVEEVVTTSLNEACAVADDESKWPKEFPEYSKMTRFIYDNQGHGATYSGSVYDMGEGSEWY